MRVAGLRQAEQALQSDLTGRVVQQVGATHDVRDSLRRIVDDHGEHIGKYLIASLENEVADRCGYLLAVHALDAILETDIARFDSQSCRGGCSGKDSATAAGAGIALLIFQLQAAAGTRECQIALAQASQPLIVMLAAVTLMNHRPVPLEAEHLQCAQDSSGRACDLSRPVEILDAQ